MRQLSTSNLDQASYVQLNYDNWMIKQNIKYKKMQLRKTGYPKIE